MTPPDRSHTNRLARETSPYLLQHARNPVDWHSWGDEAFAKAKSEDKPVFLSVGYSTCHWCHVMERESFEREDVAEILNAHFVSIKVDREERPEIDELYMHATQVLTGRGGWPNSVWLTPDGRPWFAGTYFPREDRAGAMGFKSLLLTLADAWRGRRSEVEQQADRMVDAVRKIAAGDYGEGAGAPVADLVAAATDELRQSFDDRHGGFGGAPKFPPHGSLDLIFREYRRTKDGPLLEMASRTLHAMALGGIRDHVGGGFHRYSTDAEWFVPHFEKMLYDNAQVSRACVDAFLLTGEESFREVAAETYEWALRDMASKEGAFCSAWDADSEGEEGKFYVWTRDEILDVLGPHEGELLCRVYGATREGNFRDEATGRRGGANILRLSRPLAETAKAEGIPLDSLRARLAKARRELLKRRAARVPPHLDDKILAGWNGLMIGSLAYGGKHLGEPRYVQAAIRAADFILTRMRKDGRLLRSYRDGRAALHARLDDYAFLACGLMDAYDATGDRRWVAEAASLADAAIERFRDERGGFFLTADDHEALLARTKSIFDQAVPSGNGAAAQALIRIGRATGEKRYLDAAKAAVGAFAPAMNGAPLATGSLLIAASDLEKEDAAPHLPPEGPDARVQKGPAIVEVYADRLSVPPGGTVNLAVRMTVDEGWHVNSHAPIEGRLATTSVNLKESPSATMGTAVFPEGTRKTLGVASAPLSVYEGKVSILVPVRIAKDAAPGEIPLTVVVSLQACDDRRCLAPESPALSVTIRIVGGAADEPPRHPAAFRSLGVGPS